MHWYSTTLRKKYYYKYTAMSEDPDVEFRMGEVYDNYDWTVEPNGSWKDVLRDHAQKLRDTHGYLRLWYSGGSDSQTILNTFIDNGIHLDEIAIVRMSPISKFDGLNMQEINRVAIPQVRKLEKQISKTRIKIYDIGYNEYVNYFKNHFNLNRTNITTFHMFFSSNAHLLIPGINAHKNVGNLVGAEKPRISMDEKGVYWYFVDEALSDHIVDPDNESCQVLFYMDPTVHAKQCYLVKHNNMFSSFTPENFIREEYMSSNIEGICRDKLFINFSMGKTSTKIAGTPKAQMAMEDAMASPTARHIYNTWYSELTRHDIDLKYFNDCDPQKSFVGKLTKKYYLS